MYYVYNGFYVFGFIAHCLAIFSALRLRYQRVDILTQLQV